MAAFGLILMLLCNWVIFPATGLALLNWKVGFGISMALSFWLNLKYPYIVGEYSIWKLILYTGIAVLIMLVLR